MNQLHYSVNSRTRYAAHRTGPPRTIRRRNFPLRPVLTLLCAVMLMLLDFSFASAQRWQAAYGINNTYQVGRRGVRPTSITCTGVTEGYIAVGHSIDPNSNDDVYVVRTNNAGGNLWEYTYDINTNTDDNGESIVELPDGSGFVVVGRCNSTSGIDFFLMMIDCQGVEQWTRIYNNGEFEDPHDLIVNSDGDLVVAGTSTDGVGDAEAFLLRANSGNGAVLQYQTYDLGPDRDEGFWSLTQVEPYGTQLVGDIVAVGWTGPYGGAPLGYVVRVDGNDLNFNPNTLQRAAIYTGGEEEQFYSVTELQNPNEQGTNNQQNVVIGGYTKSSPNSASKELYLVKLDGGDPCAPALQKALGHGGPTDDDEAHCVREITFTPTGSASFFQWDIIIAGYTQVPGPPSNAILLSVDPNLFLPTGITKMYGHPDYLEDAWSVYPIEQSASRTEGFIVCGETQTPWHTGAYDDWADLYLFKTDNIGFTHEDGGCFNAYDPPPCEIEWSPECLEPQLSSSLLDFGLNPDQNLEDTYERVCTGDENDGNAKRIILRRETENELSLRPNPLERNRPLMLTLSGFESDSELILSVTNTLGEVITSEFDQFTPATGEILVKTTGWPAGLYHITVQNGERRWTTQVVVLE